MTLDVPVQDKNEWRVQPLDLASEIRMQLILKSILQEHLEGYPTTFEEAHKEGCHLDTNHFTIPCNIDPMGK